MLFAHDTEVALAAAAALVNTKDVLDPDHEALPDVAALREFVRTWGWTGQLTGDDEELQQVRDLRPRLRQIWLSDEDEVVRIVNELLREAGALPQLVKHDEWPYHLHATPAAAPLASRMAVEAAMAIVDVVRSEELSRLRICDSPTCDDVVVDLSKNRSKRFCDGSCGNRAAVAAYRARRAGRTSGARPKSAPTPQP
ncbi:CGNR zinc finger domain-containing protein [Nakamurella sp. GG22]